ncbi:MAG: DUF935 family protein [Muribaculaceae bacterium]
MAKKGKNKNTAPKQAPQRRDTAIISRVVERNTSITRKDISDWKAARQQAVSSYEPKQVLLQNLYDEVMLDALMTSQVGLRIDKSQGVDFNLLLGKTPDEQSTQQLKDSGLFDSLVELIVESKFYGCSVLEFYYDNGGIQVEPIPRQHISPKTGRFYPDTYISDHVEYRKEADFGKWIVEIYQRKGDLGLLNKAVPYVLMKRFALSCWSELCEIFGIPPRVMKTNTTDTEMLNRAEQMMKSIGSAAYFIIDTEENFEFAQGTATNGDVYKNLIDTCDQQLSLLNLAAVLGQDTVNGNRSKEESSSKLLESVVKADNRFIESTFNKTLLPALASIGVIKPGLRLSIAKEVDVDKLWKMVYEGSQYYEFDTAWIHTTFGIEVVGTKQQSTLPTPTKPKKGKVKEKKDDEPEQGEEQRDSLLDFFV